jgi:hypothetical protein
MFSFVSDLEMEITSAERVKRFFAYYGHALLMEEKHRHDLNSAKSEKFLLPDK